jgi:hypothetical protein
MGFKAVHTGQAKVVNKRVRKTAEMTFWKDWRIIMRKDRYTNLSDSCQSMKQIARVS